MLIDGISLSDGSVIQNTHVESGATFPLNPTTGRIFYLTELLNGNARGLYVYNNVEWITGDITSIVANFGTLGGGSVGDIDIEIDTTVIATRTFAESLTNALATTVNTLNDSVVSDVARLSTRVTDLNSATSNTVTALATTVEGLTTTDIVEDSNLYYTPARVVSLLAANGLATSEVNLATSKNFVPATANILDLGLVTASWRTGYVDLIHSDEIHIASKKALSDISGVITLQNDIGLDTKIKASGIGNLVLESDLDLKINANVVILAGRTVSSSTNQAIRVISPIDMADNIISNISTPINTTDAANKAYVDSLTSESLDYVRVTTNQTIAGTKTFTGNTVFNGNVTISGESQLVVGETVLINDNLIELNSNFTTGTPTEEAGIQVRRGDLPSVKFVWDEANDVFTMKDSVGTPLSLGTAATISAGSFTGPVTGNSSTATILETPRTINGTNFNGSTNIVTSLWGSSRNITIGTSAKAVNGSANIAYSLVEIGAAPIVHTHVIADVTSLQIALDSKAFVVDTVHLVGDQTIAGVKTFSSNIVGSINGNAGTSTILATARNINGTSFNGSADIVTTLWGASRNITIGTSAKAVDGSVNVAYSLVEIGAAAIAHTHVIADVTGLQNALDGKMSTGTVAIATGGTGAITAEAATTNLGAARINPTVPKTGDIKVLTGVVSMYSGAEWLQIYPAVYSA